MTEFQKLVATFNAIPRSLLNIPARRAIKKRIMAMVEGGREILTPSVTKATSTSKVVDKNNYNTYASQVTALYQMYIAESVYGNEYARGIVDFRVAFLGGEGISVVTDNPEAKAYLDGFIRDNRLNGSGLIDLIQIGEMEGRCLIEMLKGAHPADNEKKIVKINPVAWINFQYEQNVKGNIEIQKDKKQGKAEEISAEDCVFVQIGGCAYNPKNTSGRIHTVLTDIENMSRAKYDLRRNAHLFGKVTPNWKTDDVKEAEDINTAVSNGDWQIGTGYAGPADFSYKAPDGGAAAIIDADSLKALKAISTTTGIPIHWLAYPELMSNRATAENMYEVVNAATKKERLIWEEALTELCYKAIRKGSEYGILTAGQFADVTITVKLPLVSIANLKQMIEIWYPLYVDGLISKQTFQNMLPGINPEDENWQIQQEKLGDHNEVIDKITETGGGEDA